VPLKVLSVTLYVSLSQRAEGKPELVTPSNSRKAAYSLKMLFLLESTLYHPFPYEHAVKVASQEVVIAQGGQPRTPLEAAPTDAKTATSEELLFTGSAFHAGPSSWLPAITASPAAPPPIIPVTACSPAACGAAKLVPTQYSTCEPNSRQGTPISASPPGM
jgi:hypothetical protein